MKRLRIAIAQINPTVGDFKGNVGKIIDYIRKAKSHGAQLVAFPELSVTGYPPEDLLLKPQFITDNMKALDAIRAKTSGITAVVGFVDRKDDIYNSAAIISDGRVVDVYHKIYLPNYGVFDEFRYFQSGSHAPVYRLGDAAVGVNIGVNICEDIWYPEGPAREQALGGAEVIININASPYTMGKGAFREKMLSTRASDSAVIIAYANMVGGQDELVFDGGSLIVDEKGDVVARGLQFEEDLIVADLDIEGVFTRRLHDPRRRQQVLELEAEAAEKINILPGPQSLGPKSKKLPPYPPGAVPPPALGPEEEVYAALVLGVKDYVRKNGFERVLIGLSGGVDSALVAAVAVDALGKDRVSCLFMPSKYTSNDSREDSYELSKRFGMKLIEIPIDPLIGGYIEALKPVFKGLKTGVAEENIQARIRGNLLMALSNKFGWLVLTTGNKSEMSVGYATLYGDMAGGFAVIKDVPKTLVYKLAKWRNETERAPLLGGGRAPIPERVLWKEPTAELRADQKDTDTLPPYPVLDPVLKAYIEEEKSFDEILELGCEPDCAKKVIGMVDGSEYKRRQAPPGIKITPRAFGRDRRFPITNRYKSY